MSAGTGLAIRCTLAALALGLGARAAEPSAALGSLGPLADVRLVLWLDAQDLRGDGGALSDGTAVSRWADRSTHGNDAVQTAPERQPTVHADAGRPGVFTVRFEASRQSYLSAGNPASLNLRQFTVFAVARAALDTANMWLVGKNHWGPPWTGYGIAVSRDGLHPWPHLGLGRDGAAKGAQLRHDGSLGAGLAIVEVSFDGSRFSQALDGAGSRGIAVRAAILANDRELLVGAGPQVAPATEFLQGEIAEILLYDQALPAPECDQVRRYLATKYAIALAEASSSEPGVPDEPLPMTAADATPETRTLAPAEAAAVLRRDWLFQAAGRPLRQCIVDELGWARALAARLGAGRRLPALEDDLAELALLEQRLRDAGASLAAAEARELYLAVRQVKRRILFRDPAIAVTSLLLVDSPYPQGSEWPHEALHHLGKRAATGGRLLRLDGLHPGGTVTRLLPNQTGAFLRPDLSFDGRRILLCFKPDADRTYHLYEVNADGSALRQLTFGEYDDISPIYLPDGAIMFCTTRANCYVRCGPYIESTVLARCAADGRGIYLVSANNEPDYTPALLPDGRVLYTRWEYTDKEQIRVQSLWTVNPDGTGVSAYWGNQSFWPDMLFEARPIPGSQRVSFAGVGHHNVFSGSIGIIDRDRGLNYPDGLTKVTPDVPWGEVGDGPAERPESTAYHSSGDIAAYRSPYPLSDSLFLVSARRRDAAFFQLYLLDLAGNRELIYEGAYNVLHALPLGSRPRPPRLPDRVTWAGREREGQPVAPAVLFSADVYAGLPDVPRGKAKYLRVIQQDSTTFSLGCKAQQPGDTQTQPIMLGGPPLSLTVVDGIKHILGTVPIATDGSVCLEVPPGRALHFQLLDEAGLALQTMRSFTNLMPGEQRGCVGCHELHSVAPGRTPAEALRRAPSPLEPPPWGADYTLGYERDIQPILDRYCGACHQGEGKARGKFDLTLRPGAGIFKEPYVTLVLGKLANPTAFDWPPVGCAGGIAGSLIPVAMPRETMLRTVPPMTALSYKSPLLALVMGGAHHDLKLDRRSVQTLGAWVDLLCPYRGEPEVRAMPDPDPAPFVAERWSILPRMRTAPIVKREYCQDDYSCPEDRLPKDNSSRIRP
jgi:hypothetical protein